MHKDDNLREWLDHFQNELGSWKTILGIVTASITAFKLILYLPTVSPAELFLPTLQVYNKWVTSPVSWMLNLVPSVFGLRLWSWVPDAVILYSLLAGLVIKAFPFNKMLNTGILVNWVTFFDQLFLVGSYFYDWWKMTVSAFPAWAKLPVAIVTFPCIFLIWLFSEGGLFLFLYHSAVFVRQILFRLLTIALGVPVILLMFFKKIPPDNGSIVTLESGDKVRMRLGPYGLERLPLDFVAAPYPSYLKIFIINVAAFLTALSIFILFNHVLPS